MRSFCKSMYMYFVHPLDIVRISLWYYAVQFEVRNVWKWNHETAMMVGHTHKASSWHFFLISLSSTFLAQTLCWQLLDMLVLLLYPKVLLLIFSILLSTLLISLFKCQLFWAFHQIINYYTILAYFFFCFSPIECIVFFISWEYNFLKARLLTPRPSHISAVPQINFKTEIQKYL